MNAAIGAGLGLAPTSTTLTNLGHLRERDAAAALPCLSIRRPLHSVTLLLTSRRWALGFAMEASGFLLYALALALLTLVQSIAAGEVGVQLGYQTGGAVTVAGLATLLSNAVPIVAGTVVLHEPVPSGSLGDLRALAFVAVSAGAFLLAQPDDPGTARPVRGAGVTFARRSSHAA